MFDVLIKSLTFVLIIVIGYLLKTYRILDKKDANVLATIIMNVTLPCALLSNANGIELNLSVFILIFVAIGANFCMIFIGYLLSRKESSIVKGAYMVNTSGYNIGNFVLAFVQSFFPGAGVAYLCSFDIGNSMMCLGITYALSDHVARGESSFCIRDLLKKLFSSIPFDVYMLVFVLALLNLKIPAPLLSITDTIGAGNSFLAMLMIGIMLEIKVSRVEARHIIKILSSRYIATIIISILAYFLLPIPLLARKIVILACFAPLSTVSAVFTKRLGYEGDMSASANSLSIMISIVCLTVLLLMFI